METKQPKIQITKNRVYPPVTMEDFVTNCPTVEQFMKAENLCINIRKTERQVGLHTNDII